MSYPDIENTEDYAKYEAAVESGGEGLEHFSSGVCLNCSDCEDYCAREDYDSDEDWYEAVSESHFSWSDCDLCNRQLGGDRYPAHALSDDREITHLDVCDDCVYYIEYGRLDDTTIDRIER